MARHRSLPQLVVKSHDPRRARLIVLIVVGLWLMTNGLAWHLGGHGLGGNDDAVRARLIEAESTLASARTELEAAQQRVSVLERSDQVSRTANEALQATLREREEELAALRADLAFYQRLVGGRAPRQGLTVHALQLEPIGDSGAYAFKLTLTQNLKKGALTEAQATLALDGVQGQQLTTLSWPQLVQNEQAPPLAFAFKYFQQVDGSVMLPDGFVPNRVRVVVKSTGGDTVERSFEWSEAAKAGENDDVRQ